MHFHDDYLIKNKFRTAINIFDEFKGKLFSRV